MHMLSCVQSCDPLGKLSSDQCLTANSAQVFYTSDPLLTQQTFGVPDTVRYRPILLTLRRDRLLTDSLITLHRADQHMMAATNIATAASIPASQGITET